MPALNVKPLRRLGAEQGVLLDLKAIDGPIAVTVLVKGSFTDEGGHLHLAWERQPDVGDPIAEVMRIGLLRTRSNRLHHFWHAACPHCGRACAQLLYAVQTWSCRRCLGVRNESLRQGKLYTAQKLSREMRQRLGLSPAALSPIVIKNARYLPLAERLCQVELQMVSMAACRRS